MSATWTSLRQSIQHQPMPRDVLTLNVGNIVKTPYGDLLIVSTHNRFFTNINTSRNLVINPNNENSNDGNIASNNNSNSNNIVNTVTGTNSTIFQLLNTVNSITTGRTNLNNSHQDIQVIQGQLINFKLANNEYATAYLSIDTILEEYLKCRVICSDCEKESISKFHYLGIECRLCGSFNTSKKS